MNIKVICLRQILRDVRRLPADRQVGVVDLFRAAVRVAGREEFPGPGEGLRLYRPRVEPEARLALRARVVAALAAGQKPVDIARRERVSRQWVYKVRQGMSPPQP